MKIKITGASNFVNRMFEACGTYQWAREFLKNSLEAGARRVEFGIEWQAVEKFGVYRRTVMDDGMGMDRDQLLKFFSTLGEGAKKIGGLHDNFGVGAKIASLPWNPQGVVVISYKAGRGSMIWIVLDPDSGDYELAEFETGHGRSCVIDPGEVEGIDWSKVRPDWITEHGTVIALLGSEQNPDTVLGNTAAGEKEIKGISIYLNSRFWDLTDHDVKVVEVRSAKKTQWPQAANEEDDSRRPNNRTIEGAKHYLTDVKGGDAPAASGEVWLDNERVQAEWYLWRGERPRVETYAQRHGYIAVRYKDELFELTTNKTFFRAFGITESQVQQNLSIVLVPQLYEAGIGRWGVHPDQSRNRLIFSGNGERGAAIPLTEWGVDFACNMPAEIREAIRAARGEGSGSIEDEDYRKRLQDKFGSRWSVKVLVQPAKKRQNEVLQPVTATEEQVLQPELFEHGDPAEDDKKRRKKRKPTLKIVEKMAAPGVGSEGVEKNQPVDVPRYRLAHKDDFEEPWHLAMWAPNDIQGPHVLVNVDSPLLEEMVKHHQSQYPDVFAEEVADTVRKTICEIAACKVAHSQQLSKMIPEEQLNEQYRNEASLTISLMGLIAEESVIQSRLGKLGSKKKTVA